MAEEALLEEYALAQFSIIVSSKFSYKFDTPQDTSIFLKFASEFSPTICKPKKFHAKIFRQRERESVSNGSNSGN